ncbi:MAG TPA: biopolymer transporter ExbD [Chitinophagales bacterium]|nr:biopolymer transporter ExbD [Chitinophagales bacterium]HMZ90298.1 biopolymer transporter ExbD [Chitinophagales bacterium]HNA58812.1 biopolymer transporter ExbD [Chitinophagales bacterium]HNE45183.1 biopolymer transporter ExbD [Chitinophagales bacterium]HNF70238.1 biopolymer transporter ExbD [Chitinophagales bacterium]
MKIGRRRKTEAEVFSASMNDIMFFLMLFFLIISTLANPNVIKVMLPNAENVETTYNKQEVSLTVTADKQFFVNDSPVAFEMLESSLISATGGSEDKVVLLRADATLTIQDLVDVLQIGAKNNLHIVMNTAKSSN